jgi:hypothetical protein
MRKFTVDEYHQMIQTGILTEDDPVELLEGWIIQKMPHKPPHDGTVEVTGEVLRSSLPSGWKVRIQSAVTLADSEPEPDVTVVAGSVRSHFQHHPKAHEIGVLIEVSDSTLARDRQDKGRVYSRAAIGCYWIINLVDRQIEVYTDPTGPDPNPSYRQSRIFGINDAVPLVLDGKEVAQIPVRDLLP